jgi:phosphoribosylanthranilate isomerase
MKTKDYLIKVCGLTDPHNIMDLIKLEPDMMGLIFYKKSPRFVDILPLSTWFKSKGNGLLGNVKKVGVFVNEEPSEIIARCVDFDLQFLQLHGNEDPNYLKSLITLLNENNLGHTKIIKAFGVSESFDFKTLSDFNILISYFLFDTKTEKKGGSGLKFPWSKLEEYVFSTPFLLSGGIGPLDVEELKRLDHPKLAGFDVNSKFEMSPGMKNISLLQVFFNSLNEFRLNSKFLI